MVLANKTISADKWERLPKVIVSVYMTHQDSGEMEESQAEKPEIHIDGQDRSSQDTAAFAPGLTKEQESRQKGSPYGN